MRNLSIKILFLGLCFFIISLNASAQCVDDAKKLEKFKKTYRDKGIQDGIKFLTDEIAKNPNCFWFYVKRGDLHNYSRDYDLIFADYRKAFETASLTTSPVWDAEKNFYTGDDGKIEINLAEIGGKANKEQNNKVCIDAYSFALELRKKRDKKFGDYLFGHGDCSYNSQNYEAASGDYLQGIELISGENPGGAIRAVNAILGLPKVTNIEKFRLLGCRLKSKNNDSEGAVADCTEALKLDPNLSEARQLLAEAKRNEANKKAEEERQARIAEEKRRQKRAETERQEREFIANLKQNKPKRYELLQKAIEQNDTESIKLLVAGIRDIYFDNPTENFDGNFPGAVLYLRVFSPKLDIGLLENKLSMRISRPADLVLVPANRNNSDGKEAISKENKSFDVAMSATYSIFFSGKKISPLLTDSATFRNG